MTDQDELERIVCDAGGGVCVYGDDGKSIRSFSLIVHCLKSSSKKAAGH